MASLKTNEIRKMNKEEKKKKLKELKIELIKSKANPSKKGPKIREIKKTISKILTLNTHK